MTPALLQIQPRTGLFPHRCYRLILGLVAGVAIFFGSSQALAQPEDEEPDTPVSAPDTKSGHELNWVLEVVNGRDLGDPSQKFTEHFLEMVPPRT